MQFLSRASCITHRSRAALIQFANRGCDARVSCSVAAVRGGLKPALICVAARGCGDEGCESRAGAVSGAGYVTLQHMIRKGSI